MDDNSKTKEQLIKELLELRRQVKNSTKEKANCALEGNITDPKLKKPYCPNENRCNESIIAQQALIKNQKGMAIILDSMSDMVIYHDLDMKVVWANKATYVSVKLKPDQLLGNYCYNSLHQRTRPCEGCPVQRVLTTGEPCESEMHSDGYMATYIRAYPVFDKDGVLLGVAEVSTNITEHKLIQAALRDSKEEYRCIFENAAIGIALTDKNGNCLRTNSVLQKMLGYNEKELNGKNFNELMYPQDAALNLTEHQELVNGTIDHFQAKMKRYIKKDGSIIWGRMNISAFKTDKDHIYNIMMVDDISECKAAEEALQESEEKFRQLFHNAYDAIFLYELIDSIPGNFIEVNNVACQRLGYSREELLSKSPIDIIDASNFNEFWSKFTRELHAKGHVTLESINVKKNRTKFDVEVSSHLFKLKNKNLVITAARDITQRKKSEKELMLSRQKVYIAERLASLGTMAAGIAHEISQPLNAMRITVDGTLYLYELGKKFDLETTVDHLKTISKQVDRIDEIIKRMRSFVKMEKTRKVEPCDLNEALEGALDLIKSQLVSHNVIMKRSLQNNLPPVMGCRIRLEEMIINLIINAMHFMDKSNRKEKVIFIRTFLKKNIVLEIIDNGTGIKEEHLDKIFDPFFTTKEANPGMGLGLSIVHSIVKAFQGDISARNNSQGGATIRIEFLVRSANIGG